MARAYQFIKALPYTAAPRHDATSPKTHLASRLRSITHTLRTQHSYTEINQLFRTR